jgi:hypothetical protein
MLTILVMDLQPYWFLIIIRLKNQQEKPISPRMSNLEGKHKKGRGKGDHKTAKKKST